MHLQVFGIVQATEQGIFQQNLHTEAECRKNGERMLQH